MTTPIRLFCVQEFYLIPFLTFQPCNCRLPSNLSDTQENFDRSAYSIRPGLRAGLALYPADKLTLSIFYSMLQTLGYEVCFYQLQIC